MAHVSVRASPHPAFINAEGRAAFLFVLPSCVILAAFVYWPILRPSINGISNGIGVVLQLDVLTNAVSKLPNQDATDFRSSTVLGPADFRCRTSRARSSGAASASSSAARQSGSAARAASGERNSVLPRCSFVSKTSSRSASSPPQLHFVFGHEANPFFVSSKASSCVAAKRLGMLQSWVSVSSLRSARNASASSSVRSFRSGVSLQSWSRRERSSASGIASSHTRACRRSRRARARCARRGDTSRCPTTARAWGCSGHSRCRPRSDLG